MKTNFLYFRENGKQVYTYSSGGQTFTINGDSNWDLDVAADTEVKVTVTDISAGTDTVIADNGKSFSSNVITIAAASSNGFDLAAGDIVTIELIPVEGTEACFRADRLLSVHSNSDTATEITFAASNGASADDTVILTHPDGNGAEFKLIAEYINDVCNGKLGEGVVTVWDKQNGVTGKGLAKAGVTKMLLAIA
jgi:hypothetical protein